jgi:hypothetical protein
MERREQLIRELGSLIREKEDSRQFRGNLEKYVEALEKHIEDLVSAQTSVELLR